MPRARTTTFALGDWPEVKQSGKEIVRGGVRSFLEHDLLSFASAIAFQVLFALIPLSLAALALLGFLNLEDIWSNDLAPRVRERVAADAYSVIDRTVEQILGEKRLLWLTFGVVFAVWQLSGAVRATMGPLNRIYGTEENRPWWHRFLVSIGLALAIFPLVGGAALLLQIGGRVNRWLGTTGSLDLLVDVVRWGLAIAALAFAVWLLLKGAPATPETLALAGLGSAFILISWIVASVAFGFYATTIANYRSAFGSLATVIVLLTYLYVSSIALLFGAVLDARVREQLAGRG